MSPTGQLATRAARPAQDGAARGGHGRLLPGLVIPLDRFANDPSLVYRLLHTYQLRPHLRVELGTRFASGMADTQYTEGLDATWPAIKDGASAVRDTAGAVGGLATDAWDALF